ncbi:M3 family oligoendopeptidase [Niameybacter massiliensis]|uniref:M3 family oligoendopeptidase n=1 Tax=Niameybacter massiliensis TaxID=1658108 RepID=UPI0006B5E9D3|nr:M3 family metallopeptidase [Niameybacter massiliensis]
MNEESNKIDKESHQEVKDKIIEENEIEEEIRELEIENELEEEKQGQKRLKKRIIACVCSLMIILLLIPFFEYLVPQNNGENVKESLIDLTNLYPSSNAWEKAYKQVTQDITSFTNYEGQLKDENKLLECLKLDEQISRNIHQLSVYTVLKTSLDQSDQQALGQKGKIGQLLSEYIQKSEFILLELGEYGLSDIEALQQKEVFQPYKKILEAAVEIYEEGLDTKSYTFYVKMMTMLEQIDTVYEQILYADNGEVKGNIDYVKRLREKQYSLAALYNMEVSKEIIFSEALGYDNIIEYLTDKQGVDLEVYETAKEEIMKMQPLLERYLEIRKKLSLSYSQDTYHYNKVPTLIEEAYGLFGTAYTDVARRAFEENWIDPFKEAYKIDGAFTIGSYDTHPYVILNYEATPYGLGVVAHELGHAVHYELARANQPYNTWKTDIFASEIASLTAEKSAYETMYQKGTTNEQRKQALILKADSLMNSLFYQMVIATFEEKAYTLVAEGESLTADRLNSLWKEANRIYFGESNPIEGEWASISHIFENFYTFQYATASVASEIIISEVIKGNEEMQTNWMHFLESGGNKTGYELTKEILGMNLASPEYYERVADHFEAYIDELETFTK